MKKVILTIVAIGCISTTIINTAFAGDRYMSVLNPLWLPAAILTSVAATVAAIATINQPPVVYEQRGYSEPRQTVIYEEPRQTVVYAEPRHYRHDRYYGRVPADYRNYGRERVYEAPRYREYR